MADRDNYSTKGPYGLKKCHDNANALLDVVFIHGLTGNRETTWTDKTSGIFWPEAFLKNDIPEARILTFGYDADVVHFWAMASQNRIGNHAQNLVNVLAHLRERSDTNERPIIFVAHSLGGLVVEDAMLASKNSAEPHIRQLLDCIVGVAFMGTPHCGSDLSNWAKMFGNFTNIFKKTNTSLLGTLEPQSEVLARIQKEFHTMLRARRDDGKKQLLITCFFEELPVRGIGEIVPMHSAILPAYNAIGIRSNHMDMTKFALEEDPGYLAVSSELWRWAKQIKSQLQVQEASSSASTSSATGQNLEAWPSEMLNFSHPHQQWLIEGGHQYNQPLSAPQQRLPQNNYTQYHDQQRLPPIPDPQTPSYHPSPQESRISIGGNTIGAQNISGNGKTVQGNNIRSEKDVTFNL